jgi:hypothetical protein
MCPGLCIVYIHIFEFIYSTPSCRAMNTVSKDLIIYLHAEVRRIMDTGRSVKTSQKDLLMTP